MADQRDEPGDMAEMVRASLRTRPDDHVVGEVSPHSARSLLDSLGEGERATITATIDPPEGFEYPPEELDPQDDNDLAKIYNHSKEQ